MPPQPGVKYFICCGAVIGDMSGSTLEGGYCKERPGELFKKRSHFTDDTVLTCAVALGLQKAMLSTSLDALMAGEPEAGEIIKKCLRDSIAKMTRRYPRAGYGKKFRAWIELPDEQKAPYGSFGNGAPMRASYAGWLARNVSEAWKLGELTASVTHNHPEGLKAAAVTASAIQMLASGAGKRDVYDFASQYYNLAFTLDAARAFHSFNSSSAGTMPVALMIFLEGRGFEDIISLADSMAGDVDTLAAIAGSLAEAACAVPGWMLKEAWNRLDPDLRRDFREITDNWLAMGGIIPEKPELLPSMKAEIVWKEAN